MIQRKNWNGYFLGNAIAIRTQKALTLGNASLMSLAAPIFPEL
jgi:hypothetical protein